MVNVQIIATSLVPVDTTKFTRIYQQRLVWLVQGTSNAISLDRSIFDTGFIQAKKVTKPSFSSR